MALTQISTEGIKNGTITGADLATNVDLVDNQKIRFGTGNDLQISHDPSTGSGLNLIKAVSGFMMIQQQGNGSSITLAATNIHLKNHNNNETFLHGVNNGAVSLYYDNNKKFETSNTGGTLTGRFITGSTTNLATNSIASSTQLAVASLGGNNNFVDLSILGGRTGRSMVKFGDQDNYNVGSVEYSHSDNSLNFFTNGSTTSHLTIASNGAISVSGTVDGRDLATDGAKLDTIESNATADQTASEILTLLKTVDGSGSGLNADTLDGIGSSGFLRANATTTYNANGNDFTFDSDGSRTLISFKYNGALRWQLKQQSTGENLNFDRVAGSGVFQVDGNRVLTTADEGSGNGLDADTLDGIQASSFLRSDATDSASSNITINGLKVGGWAHSNSFKGIYHTNQSGQEYMIINADGHTYISATTSHNVYIRNGNNDSTNQLIIASGNDGLTWRGNKIFHAGNDGSGSGLDADTLDGAQPNVSASNNTIVKRHASGYVFANYFNTTANDVSSGVTKVMVETGNDNYIRHGTAAAVRTFLNVENGATADQTAADIRGLGFFDTSNDGSGSGLDSDTVDGIHGASFARSDQDDTMSGSITLSKDATDVINFSANASSDNRGIAFNNRTALSADYNDGYLRLNNNSEFSNGVYTPGVLRVDGDLDVRGGAGAITVQGNSDITFNNGSTWSGNHTKIGHHGNYLYIVGGSNGIVFREGGNNRAIIDGSGHLVPGANNTYNLGSSSTRWSNIYTNDLNLSNEGGSNDVDSTWGSYTIQEGAEDLFLINRRNGKKYKFNLAEV